MNKQNLWFITLFSIILVLSIYYISMPSNILEEYTSNTSNNNETTVSELTPQTSLVALRVASDEELLNNINTKGKFISPLDTHSPANGIIIPAGRPGKFKYSKNTIININNTPYCDK